MSGYFFSLLFQLSVILKFMIWSSYFLQTEIVFIICEFPYEGEGTKTELHTCFSLS